MSEKAIAIGLYAVASGIFTAFTPAPRIAGSSVVRKYLEEDVEKETGGKFLFASNMEDAAKGILAHIDAKRKALKLAPRPLTDVCSRGRAGSLWDAGRPRNTARRGLQRPDVRAILIFNRERCLACRACELACSVAHSRSGQLETAIAEELPPKRRVTMAAGKDGIDALRCEQCAEPLCAFSCKSGALHRDPISGWIALEESRCVGCFMCMMVCPHGIRPDPATDRVVRCDVCLDREIPACVAACPTGALGNRSAAGRARAPSEFKGHVVVVGSSAAGIAACEAAREHAPECSITLVTADASPQYSRPLLAYVLAGRIGRPRIDWRDDGYLEHDLKVRVLHKVGHALACQSLLLDDGTELAFDRLIVATGARAATLSIPGADLAGVHALRNLEDLDADREGWPRLAAARWCWAAATSVSRPARRSSPAGWR